MISRLDFCLCNGSSYVLTLSADDDISDGSSALALDERVFISESVPESSSSNGGVYGMFVARWCFASDAKQYRSRSGSCPLHFHK
ncbi:hypothetical protein OGATHE_002837 [Ogataea polymorpha]|uniref:Uncharacterized protein n=1 Tax=Ogataea polymorpha TaxID=460523 RepID=A0A9P8T8Y2_9ASCO|nr:hypothetical protein OGATHE_002837 [Ogataea polymorpha]